METNSNSSNSNGNSKSRTLIIGAIAGIVVAGALGAAFMLGGRASGANGESASADGADGTPTKQTANASATAASGGAQQTGGVAPETPDGSQSDQSQDGPDPQQPQATATPIAPEPEAEEEAEPTDTPTATPTATPWGPDDLAAEPTATSTPNPCPLCNDLELAVPIDFIPQIDNISTSFCYPTLAVFFDLAYADAVWFTYYDGSTHHSQHIDADTFLGFLTVDLSDLGWGYALIESIHVHATDIQGNHTVSDAIPMPDWEAC